MSERRVRILQISDTHICPPGVLAYGKVDTADALARMVAHVSALEEDCGAIDAIVVSGDVAEDGSAAAYRAFRALTAPLRDRLFLLPGNHDTRDGMRAAFVETTHLPPGPGPMDWAARVGSMRLIGLDTTVPGAPHGMLSHDQLVWLETELLTEALPTLVFMHHPPFDTGIGHMDVQRLRNGDALIDLAARHPCVLLLACGHVHRSILCAQQGVSMAIAPAPAHAVALCHAPGAEPAFRLEPGAALLHVWEPVAEDPLGRLTSSVSFIDVHPGPFPFFGYAD
ncbi:MAG: phosphodiesterase [Pseudomonadota bacterium]